MSYDHSSRAHRRTLKDIIAAQQGEGEKKVETPSSTKKQVPDWAVFKTAPNVPDLNHKQIHDILFKHACFSDTKTLTLPGTNEGWKFSYPSMAVGADKNCYNSLVDYYLTLPTASPEADVIKSCIIYANNVVSSNGTMQGLVQRMVTQLPGTEPILKPRSEELQLLTDMLPFGFSAMELKIPDTPDWDDGDVFDITETADAGCPFMITDPKAKCDGPNLLSAIKIAERYIKMLDADDEKLTKTNEYFKQHPEECLFMLKRKLERMPLSARTTKVRPYFVPPLPLKLLFMWVAHYIQTALLNYTQTAGSASAYKTSWFYGGTTMFITTLHDVVHEAVEKKEVVFRSVFYGDDATWIFAFPDGTYVVMTPDVSGMDMHVAKAFGGVTHTLVDTYHHADFDQHLPRTFSRVLKLLLHFAFTTNLHVVGSYNMLKMWGLCSGIPLTTIIDMVASGYISAIVTTSMKAAILPGATSLRDCKTYNAEHFDMFLKHVVRRVHVETSCIFKEGTLVPYVYEPGNQEVETEYNWGFLGVSFKYIFRTIKMDGEEIQLEGWVPVPMNIEKYAASYVHPTRHKSGPVQTMERIYGLMLSGAWMTPLAPLFRAEYERLLNLKYQPKVVDCIPACGDDIDDIAEVLLSNSPELPSDDTLACMYLMPPEDFARYTQIIKPRSVAVRVEEKPVVSVDLDDIVSEELSLAFGTIKVAARHAGQPALPKPKPMAQAQAQSQVAVTLRATRPVLKKDFKPGVKKGGKLAAQMQQVEEEHDDSNDDSPFGGDDDDDFSIG